MPPTPSNYRELQELTGSVVRSRPELLNEIKILQLGFPDYLRQRIDSAMEEADTEAIITLARLNERIEAALEKYTDNATRQYKHRMENLVLDFACDDSTLPNAALCNEVLNNVQSSTAATVDSATKLLAYYGILETYLNGKEPTGNQDISLIAETGFSGVISRDQLAAVRSEIMSEETELHGEFGPPPPMTTKGATLILDASLTDDLNLDNASEQLRSGKHDKWVHDAFRNMLRGIYTDAELDELAEAGKDPMDGIFIDGTPLSAAIKGSSIYVEGADKQTQLVRCTADLILQGNKKLSAVRYEKAPSGEFILSDKASTVQVKPAIEEKFNLWRSIKRLFGFEKSFEERKEAISVSKLADEEAAERIAENVAIINSKKYIRDVRHHDAAVDDKFFNHELPEDIDPQKLGAFYNIDSQHTEKLITHMSDRKNRIGLLNAYMLSQGMSLSDVMSDDPALDETKRQHTHDLLNKFKVDTLDEFYERNKGLYPQKRECAKIYKNYYIKDKANELAQFYTRTLYPAVKAQTANIKAMDAHNIKSLIDNYEAIHTISDMGKALMETSEGLLQTAGHTQSSNITKLRSMTQGIADMDIVNIHIHNVLSAHKVLDLLSSNDPNKTYNDAIASRAAVEYAIPHIRNLCEHPIMPDSEDARRLSHFKNNISEASEHISNITKSFTFEQQRINAVNIGRGHAPIPPDMEDFFLMDLEPEAVMRRRDPGIRNEVRRSDDIMQDLYNDMASDKSTLYHNTLKNKSPIQYGGMTR